MRAEPRSEVVIYADESDQSGGRYGNFYGGALIQSTDLEYVRQRLLEAKVDVGLAGAEAKWNAITPRREDAYRHLVHAYFDLTEQGLVKTRIMFTDNRFEALNLNEYQRENRYHLLYYQFIRHAFGLIYCDLPAPIRARVYLDNMPQNREKVQRFKGFIASLTKNPQFRKAGVIIPEDQIAEVDSSDHVVMQMVDVVLGSMQFRLNKKHRARPKGMLRRGKKTRAKERIYEAVRDRIQGIRPNFNIGITTGRERGPIDLWHHPYRHWTFRPSEYRVHPVAK